MLDVDGFSHISLLDSVFVNYSLQKKVLILLVSNGDAWLLHARSAFAAAPTPLHPCKAGCQAHCKPSLKGVLYIVKPNMNQWDTGIHTGREEFGQRCLQDTCSRRQESWRGNERN